MHFYFTFIQDIAEVKQELKKKEQVIRQLNRQCGQLESEQKMLVENVKDAENALRTAARCVDINYGGIQIPCPCGVLA